MNKRLSIILGIATALLLVPLVAMQFTREVNWSVGDFVVAAMLLYGTGLLLEVVFRKIKTTGRRIAIGLAVVAVIALIWLELAVGLFGLPLAGS